VKAATKIVYLICLIALIVAPVVRWLISPDVDLNTMAGFVGAASGPLGVLTGAMAARGISRDRNNAGDGR